MHLRSTTPASARDLQRHAAPGRHLATRRRRVPTAAAAPAAALLVVATVAPTAPTAGSDDAAGRAEAAVVEPALRLVLAEPSPAELRRDRTRPGVPGVTPASLGGAVSPARVVPGRRLEAKPPPWQLPVEGARLTARFGASGLWASTHTGLDFAAPEGTPLHAVGDGTVRSAGSEGAYGNVVRIDLVDGTQLWYAHLSSVAVAPGQRLAPGEVVGALGSTGNSTGPHLHLEVRPGGGEPVDPEPWLAERGLL